MSSRKLKAKAAPPWVWSVRSVVWVFGLGFMVTLVLLMAFIGLWYVLPSRSTPSAAPPILQGNAPATPVGIDIEDSVGAVPLSATVGEADQARPTTQVLAEEPSQVPIPGHIHPTPAALHDDSPPVVTEEPVDSTQLTHPSAPPEVGLKPVSSPPPHGGTLTMDGQDTHIPVTIQHGVPYVPVESVAVQAGLNVEISPNGQVTVDGKPVPGAMAQGDDTLVPLKKLGTSLHRTVQPAGPTSWRMDKAGVAVKASPAAHAAPKAANDSVATVIENQSDVGAGSKPADPAPAAAPEAPKMMPVFTSPVPPGPVPEAFRPIIESNGDMQITVTNIEMASSFRDTYKPAEGKQFAIVWLSLQNTSDMLQMTSGTWELRDQTNSSFRSLDRISTLTIATMRPAGINYGYLIFEVPLGDVPSQIVYTQNDRHPLTVNLRH